MNATTPDDLPEPGARYHVFSASQVDTFLSCARKWAFRYVARCETPQNSSAQVGDRVHKQLETYLTGGALDFTEVVHGVRIAEVCASGLHLLPEPLAPGMNIETKFRFQSPATGYVWTGRKDIEVDDTSIFPNPPGEPAIAGGVPGVSDHKSTSGIFWAKDAEDLEWDVQANLYAYELMASKHATTVDLVWTYYQTKGGKASKRTHLRVHRDHAVRAFRLIEDVAREMSAVADAAPMAERETYVNTHVKPTLGTCKAFGGCPHYHRCQLTLEQETERSMSNGESFVDSLAARAAAQDGKAPAQPAAANLPSWLSGGAPAPTITEKPATTAAPAAHFGDPTTAPAPTSIPSWMTQAAPTVAPAINPPESTLPPPVQLPPPPATTASAPTAEEPKPKRGPGRPRKTPPDPLGADALAHTGTPATAQVTVDAAPQAGGFTLYVDCFPIGKASKMVERYIARAQDEIRKTTTEAGEPVADYRMLPFGQGGGVLAGCVLREILKENPEHLVIHTNTHEAHSILATLVAAAGAVVQGSR